MSAKKEYEFKSYSIKKEFAEKIEEFIKTHPEFGYRSVATLLEDSTRRRLEELQEQIKELPQFEQINSDENGVKIHDRKIHQVVQIYIKPQGIRCGFHQTNECEHIEFALKQKDVQETIRKRKLNGWKLP